MKMYLHGMSGKRMDFQEKSLGFLHIRLPSREDSNTSQTMEQGVRETDSDPDACPRGCGSQCVFSKSCFQER